MYLIILHLLYYIQSFICIIDDIYNNHNNHNNNHDDNIQLHKNVINNDQN